LPNNEKTKWIIVDLTSKEILLKIIDGDKTSFERVYRFYYPRINNFAWQYLLDSEASKNIVQDVFTELWDKRDTLKKDTNLNAWLFTVTKNKSLKAISHYKSQRNYDNYIKSRELEVNFKALAEFDTSTLVFEELQSQIKVALEKLTPACRKVFEMSRFEDKKNREIATELSLSIKTVEAQISKALRSLKVDLKDYLPLCYILFHLNE
jgi:RNA polymerase sigma-70 factor (ECF subfamily)